MAWRDNFNGPRYVSKRTLRLARRKPGRHFTIPFFLSTFASWISSWYRITPRRATSPKRSHSSIGSIRHGSKHNTLLGVTGSGKTFTVANVIAQLNRPTLVLSHNKTLAAQLYGEFRNFFPENAVEYFVSYYDYYQPEAYLPSTDTYIEKDLSINAEIEKMRLSAPWPRCCRGGGT